MTELSYYEWSQSISGSGYHRYHKLLCGNQSQTDTGGICHTDSQLSH